MSDYLQFYNLERPNQALSCGNQPPSDAHLEIPCLPRLPGEVDPDAWLEYYDRRFFRRRVNSKGTVQVDKHSYYIGRHLRGQLVQLQLDAEQKCFAVWCDKACVKHVPLKGLFHGRLPLADYIDTILNEAESEEKRLAYQRRRRTA